MINRSYKFDHPEIWKHSAVNNILKNRTYTGCLIQHTTTNINYKTKKRRAVPEEEWIIIKDNHEAIIDEMTFNLAQEIRNKHNSYVDNRRNVEYILESLVYCKDCGAKLSISYDKAKDRVRMNCGRYRKFSKYGLCFSHYIDYNKLEKTVFDSLRKKCLMYVNSDIFEKLFAKQENPAKEIENKIFLTKNKINRLETKIESIYDDKIAMYQEENAIIEQDVDRIVETYLKHEKNTYKDLKTEESAITLVTLFPELKSDSLVQEQLEIYVKNNATIKSLKSRKIGLRKLKWILYFGK